MRLLLRLLLAAMLPAFVLVAVTSAPASACSCVSGTQRAYLKWADVAVTGTLIGSADSDDGTIEYDVEVDAVLQGAAASRVVVRSASSGGACGLEGMRDGERYLFFLNGKGPAAFQANLCGGTTLASTAKVARIEQLSGGASAPASTGDAEPAAVRIDEDVPAQSVVPAWWIVGAGAGVLVALLLAGSWRRLRTRPRS